MIKIFRAWAKIILFFAWTFAIVPAQIILLIFYRGPGAYYIPQFWHKGVCRIMGLKYEIVGTPDTSHQTIFISNHISDLDIPIIGSVIRASFVAKSEVASWPVLGWLARVQQTAFISRASKDAMKVKNALDTMLNEGKSLILFPEGTSHDGSTVLPFKSSLFSLVLQERPGKPALRIQPFTLQIIEREGRPIQDQADRDYYAYYGDIEFGPHMWGFITGKGATIRLTFHPVITLTGTENRKDLAALTHKIVSQPFLIQP